MNLVDLLLGLVILASVWAGWRRGLMVAGADVLSLVVSVASAFLLYPGAVRLLERHELQWGVWTAPLAFLALYVLVRLVLGSLIGGLFKAVPTRVHAHPVNRALGALPGTVNGLINATIASMLLLGLPLTDEITRTTNESALAGRFAAPAEWLETRLRTIFDPALERTLSKLTVPPDSQQSISLPFKVETPRQRPDLESSMLDLVNEERRAHGLRPLRADPEAAEVARAHSKDMFARGYFSHITPEGRTPFERMRRSGLRFRAAGENLAFARTLQMAHKGLMNSPGHRANILRPAFGRAGIGILDGGRYGLMVTQAFRD